MSERSRTYKLLLVAKDFWTKARVQHFWKQRIVWPQINSWKFFNVNDEDSWTGSHDKLSEKSEVLICVYYLVYDSCFGD